MTEGTSSNDYRCGVMHRRGGRSLLQRVKPVPSTPLRGIGWIDGNHPQPPVSAHLHQPVAKFACRYAAHHAPHAFTPLAAPQSLAPYSPSILEVEMLDRYKLTVVGLSNSDKLTDGGTKPSVASCCLQASEFNEDGVRLTNRIASWIHYPTGEVSGIQIDC
jgi:hypothetical protein